MRVLITGGGGFIGSHLADHLLARGDPVCVIDNCVTGRRDNLSPHPDLKTIIATISGTMLVSHVFDEFQPTHVVHAAASYKDPNNYAEDASTNTLGTANVVKASLQAGVERLIYFQTSLCYGSHPTERPISLTHPLQPENSYAISKVAGERYIQLSGLDYISFRLANVYGPRNVAGPLPAFYNRLITGKPCYISDTRRDFIYIDNVIDLVLSALDGKGYGVYHVASGFDRAVAELFALVVEAMAVDKWTSKIRPRNPDDTFTILLDPSKTTGDFGWQPHTSLRDGVRETVEWYKANGIEQTYTHLQF